MDVDIKLKDMQEEYEQLIAIEKIENINVSKNKIQEIIKRGLDIIVGLLGTLLLIPITIRNIYSTKNSKRRRTNFL